MCSALCFLCRHPGEPKLSQLCRLRRQSSHHQLHLRHSPHLPSTYHQSAYLNLQTTCAPCRNISFIISQDFNFLFSCHLILALPVSCPSSFQTNFILLIRLLYSLLACMPVLYHLNSHYMTLSVTCALDYFFELTLPVPPTVESFLLLLC